MISSTTFPQYNWHTILHRLAERQRMAFAIQTPLAAKRQTSTPLTTNVVATTTGWWLSGGIAAADCVAAYSAKGAASYAASKINLNNPGVHDATDGVAPTWNAINGWTGNGTTQYLVTDIYVTQAYSMICRFSGLTNGGVVGGSRNGGRFYVVPNDAGPDIQYGHGAARADVSPAITSGIVALTPTGGYRNGALDAPLSGGAFTCADAINILRRGDTINYLAGSIQHFALYKIDISSYVAALCAAIIIL